ncbi:MAG TPA: GGDEF domain-containing protein [Vulgatibacter sp.]
MKLDLATLDVVEAVVGAELSLLLAMLLLLGRAVRAQAGLGWWVLGTIGTTLGRALHVDGGSGVSTLQAVATSVLMFLGLAFVFVGARDFCRVPRHVAWMCAWGLVVCVATAWGQGFGELALAIAGFVASAAIALTFFGRAPVRQQAGSRLAGALYSGLAAFFLCDLHLQAPWSDALGLGEWEWPREMATFSAIFFHVAWVFTAVGLTSQGVLLRLRDAAHADGLTGLANRRAIRESGGRILDLCRRKGRPCALLMADLDHFKRLNDTLGHAAGDAALRHFAEIATEALGRDGLIGRWGGEEFCFVVPGASRARARRAAQRLRQAMAASRAAFGQAELAFTVSVGVAWASGPDLDFGQMIARADEALYRAKEAGRDRVQEAA